MNLVGTFNRAFLGADTLMIMSYKGVVDKLLSADTLVLISYN